MSRSRFVLTPQARADLLEIWNYIEDSPENADLVLERLYATFRRLAERPGIGHHREDLADARHRFWTVYSYVIAYRLRPSRSRSLPSFTELASWKRSCSTGSASRLPREQNEPMGGAADTLITVPNHLGSRIDPANSAA